MEDVPNHTVGITQVHRGCLLFCHVVEDISNINYLSVHSKLNNNKQQKGRLTMDNFETALSNIDDRVKAYNATLANIKNALKKKFEESRTHREQIIKALTIILDRHDSEDFVFSNRRAGDETSYEIRRESDGLRIKIHLNAWIKCDDLDSKLLDDVNSLDGAEDLYADLILIDENNQRIDKVLKAYLLHESLRADRMKDKLEKLKAELLNKDNQ